MHLRFWLLSACLAAVCVITKAHPPGGDSLKNYCGHLTPNNDTSNAKGHVPAGVVSANETKFTVEAIPTTLHVSEATKVTIKQKAGKKFKGFLCIVSPAGEKSGFKPVGKMSGTTKTSYTALVDCAAAKEPTATGASHYNAKSDLDAGTRHLHDSATFTWTASGVTAGKYKLRCTVVEDYTAAYKGYEVALEVKAAKKNSSPRNMASGLNILASVLAVAMGTLPTSLRG